MEKAIAMAGGLVQVGPTRFMNPALAAKEGVSRYVPRTAAAPKRPVTQAAVKTGAPAKTAALPARSTPRDIPAAMRAGLSNSVIHGLIRTGALDRPRTFAEARVVPWPDDAWAEAVRRGLVW